MQDHHLLLRVEGLTKTFRGLMAVDKYSLALRTGETLGIIGPNGAGKTTVFNLISGTLVPTSGHIYFEGQDVTGHTPHRVVGRGIARTVQSIRLFRSLSVLDNVKVGLQIHARPGLAQSVLSLPSFTRNERQLTQKAERLLEVFELVEMRDQPAHSLAFGYQRRLEIAATLATHPKLLLLDEPAAGMNPSEKQELVGLVDKIKQDYGLTIMLIEHDMRVIMGICDRIQTLNYGRIIAEGTPDEIRNNPAVIEAYLGHSEPAEN